MQRNTKALLIFFSLVGAMILLLLALIFFNVKSGNIQFFFKIDTDKSEKRIQVEEKRTLHYRL
jgi:hypothetical protein